MKLNQDIISYIMSFLPILDRKIINLNKSIVDLKSTIYHLLINLYYIIHMKNDDYLSWLLNDIERWMNQDNPVMNGYTDKYIYIVVKTSNANLTDILFNQENVLTTYLDNYWSDLFTDSQLKLEYYINRLSHIEAVNLYKFIISIHFTHSKGLTYLI